jgi:hypothetical protein
MSPRTFTRNAAGPTPEQLKYLKDLAIDTGTTFKVPRTLGQASAEIDRLKKLLATYGPNLEFDRDVDPAEEPYATEQKAGETVGYGSTAGRRQQTSEELAPARPATRPAPRSEGEEPFELGRYETKAGEKRGVYGIRIDDVPRIIDAAAEGRGRTYTVQDVCEGEGFKEVKGIAAAYIAQAKDLGDIPMVAW